QQLNDQITRIGANDDAGLLLRQYWQPAALCDDIAFGLPFAVNLLSEQLALVKDNCGFKLVTRLVDESYSPRVIPRAEDIEIDVDGPIYPTVQKNGVIFAYLGSGKPPEFPNFDCFRAPDTHVFAFKGLWRCNWLQALEVGIDPAHASFLHRFLQDEDPTEGYGKQFRDTAANTNIPMTKILREYPRPEILVDETEYGLKITALRHMKNGLTHVRVTNQIFPQAICIPMSREMTITQWHVPIDNENCYWYSIFTSFDKPVNKRLMREQRLEEHTVPDYAPIKNAENNYNYDPHEQEFETYTGMGLDINVHDQWAVEGMGPIQDRTQEHLGRSDVAIIRYRRILRQAIADLRSHKFDQLPMTDDATVKIKGPLSNDAITKTSNWKKASQAADFERRKVCPWDAAI
ncbi:MAG: aromatic ring-hydroxylating dioxygenase subunit alpha, partial [Rhodobacterales bacterium]|nr:aromatic ring-hydroxylating dioxygenase subunit alpha [Rhodobacterales bacterium]